MDYKPLYELLLSGVLKRVRLSRTALKRLFKQTDFFARLPGELGTRRISCAAVLEACLPVMELLCPAPAEGWLKECYLELAHRLFPDPERGKLSSGAAQAMEFYLTVLRWFLDTEPGRCPYDPLTDIPKVKTGGSGTFDYTYDSKHNLTEATNSTVKEKYTYDSMGNALTAVLSKAEGTPDVSETIKGGKTYTNSGNLVLTDKGANGCYTTFTYGTDASKMFGAATTVRNPVGTETVTSYLNDGRVNSSKINGNIAVTRSYDSKNQLTKLTRGGYNGDDPTAYHQYYSFAYDAFGNTTAISVGNTSASTYNLGTYVNQSIRGRFSD